MGVGGRAGVDAAFDALRVGFEHLLKLVEDRALEEFDNTELVGFFLEFERFRNRLPLVDHQMIGAAGRRDLPGELCQSNMVRMLTGMLRISPAEAARRVRAAEAVAERTAMTGESLAPVRPHLAAAQRDGNVSPEQARSRMDLHNRSTWWFGRWARWPVLGVVHPLPMPARIRLLHPPPIRPAALRVAAAAGRPAGCRRVDPAGRRSSCGPCPGRSGRRSARHWRAVLGPLAQYSSEPAPTMFSNGDLPVFAASGVDVDVLWFVPFWTRHSAAMTTNPADIWGMVESDNPDEFAIPEGVAAWRAYVARCWRWAITPPGDTGPVTMSNADYDEVFGGRATV